MSLTWNFTQQIEEELNQANLNLQNAREQIGDFNLQVTILTSGKMEINMLKLFVYSRQFYTWSN